MPPDKDNVDEKPPGRRYGMALIAVSLLLLVALAFANAWCHPRARFARDVKRVKPGDTEAAVLGRMKTYAPVFTPTIGRPVPASFPVKDFKSFVSTSPDWWHIFCPEFPFLELAHKCRSRLNPDVDPPCDVVTFTFVSGRITDIMPSTMTTPFFH